MLARLAEGCARREDAGVISGNAFSKSRDELFQTIAVEPLGVANNSFVTGYI